MPTLEDTSLSDLEREMVVDLARELQEHFGERFVGLWLYGSRARGERRRQYSDVDLMCVLTEADRDDERAAHSIGWAIKTAADYWDHMLSVRVRDLAWLEDRRAIDAFFVRNIDRDRVVLAGRAA